MTPTPPDPLTDRLRDLRRDDLDDLTATRTLARAEAAFVAAAARPSPVVASRQLRRSWIPVALAAWGALYLWSAVGELRRLFPASADRGELAALVESKNSRRPASTSSPR
jgi:hypothetical protein